LAKYFRLVSTMLEVGAMTVDFYNAEATVNPARPNSQFGSLKGAYCNYDHGLTFNAWQFPRVNPELLKAEFPLVKS
jgi:hypothetical protein